jgi:hypothetical protein
MVIAIKTAMAAPNSRWGSVGILTLLFGGEGRLARLSGSIMALLRR